MDRRMMLRSGLGVLAAALIPTVPALATSATAKDAINFQAALRGVTPEEWVNETLRQLAHHIVGQQTPQSPAFRYFDEWIHVAKERFNAGWRNYCTYRNDESEVVVHMLNWQIGDLPYHGLSLAGPRSGSRYLYESYGSLIELPHLSRYPVGVRVERHSKPLIGPYSRLRRWTA
jgi:hypothetical protein